MKIATAAVGRALLVAAALSSPAAAGANQGPRAGGVFPFAYSWSKFPAAWFGANATDWESEEQIAEIGRYSMAILGWQHLAAKTDWDAIVYTQVEQAAIIKKAHPGMPVFVYSGFGFAAGFNNGTWPALDSVLKDPKGSPYRDFFLQGSRKTVETQTYCQQGHTSAGATGDRCLSFVWNMANASARDYYLAHVVAPLATSKSIDGVFYDGFNWGYILPAPWGTQTVNIPNCTNAGTVNPPPASAAAPPPPVPQGDSGFGCDALVVGSIDVARRTAQLLNKHGKVPIYSNPASFTKPAKTPIWMNESRLVDALAGTAWMVNYEFMRAESIMDGCPGAKVDTGECILNNMLTESTLGVAAGVHTYLQHVNKSDPQSPLESQMPHMAAFMLARQEHWYYFGSTGWWDNDYKWAALYDQASTCGKPTSPVPAVGSGPVYSRTFEQCKVTLDCTNSSSCKGNIKFLAANTQVETSTDDALLPLAPATKVAAVKCRSIKASATSPPHHTIRDFGHSVHYVCPPVAGPTPPRGQLFLLIPGIQPEVYHWPVETGAELGYHSLGVSWFDKPASGGVCFESSWAKRTGQTDGHNASEAMASCAHDVMLMRLLGKDDPRVPSTNAANFSIDSTDSIAGRAAALLQYLVKNGEPEWGEFLDESGGANQLRWERVAVAGHSRASGIVSALSKVPSIANVVLRMIMVGGPGDAVGNFSNLTDPGKYWVPEWMTTLPSNATHLYSLDPAYTGGCWMTQPNLQAMKVSGVASFDNTTVGLPDAAIAAALDGARQLYDQSVCLDARQTHMCLGGGDQWRALGEHGVNMVAPVWRYMLTNEQPPGNKALGARVKCRCATGPAHGPPWPTPAC